MLDASLSAVGAEKLNYIEIQAGAAFYQKHGIDIEPDGEETAGLADAIFVGAIGLPGIHYNDGTEISPHLRLRERFQLYAGLRPVRAYPNTPQRLADDRAREIDLVVLRESSEGLFYTAAVNQRGQLLTDTAAEETLRITRATTEKLHHFAFKLATKRKRKGGKGLVTCVDKANVFTSMAFFRRIFDEVAAGYPDISKGYNYIDAQALDMIRKPWEFDVLVTENMYGDILSDLAGGLVGGMGLAPCGEIGDNHALFQPSHGSAPDIMGQNRANPLAAILSGALMLEYLAEKKTLPLLAAASKTIENAVLQGFNDQQIRPDEFGGDMGTRAITDAVLNRL